MSKSIAEKPPYDPFGDGWNPLAADGAEVEGELLIGEWMADGYVAHIGAEAIARREAELVRAKPERIAAEAKAVEVATAVKLGVRQADALIREANLTPEGRAMFQEAMARLRTSLKKT